MTEQFKLPGSSLEEVKKIIMGYADLDKASSRAEVSQATGVTGTTVSRNSKFLVSIGVVESGTKKAPTEIGKRLGRALTYEAEGEIQNILSEIVSGNEFLKNIVGAVRIRKGMDDSSLRSHIAYSAGAKKSKYTAAGAGAVVEILKLSGNLKDEDGKVVVETSSSANNLASSTKTGGDNAGNNTPDAVIHSPDDGPHVSLPLSTSPFQISVNVEVKCSTDELDVLGERLRKVVNDFQKGA